MAMRTKGRLLAGATALMAVTSVPAYAAFVDAETAIEAVGSFGPGSGKDQSNVGPSTDSDDTLLAFAPFDDTADPVSFDTAKAPSDASPNTVLDAVNDFLTTDVSLTSLGDNGRFGGDNSDNDIFGDKITGDGGCTVGCNFDPDGAFAYYVVKYGQLYALFQDGGDNIAHYDLGGKNFGTSNHTYVTPLPAAAWMMIGGLGLIGGAVKWRRRGAAEEV